MQGYRVTLGSVLILFFLLMFVPLAEAEVPLDLSDGSGSPGGKVSIGIRLQGGEPSAVAMDIGFNTDILSNPEAEINPEIGPGTDTDRQLISSVPSSGVFRIGIIPASFTQESLEAIIPDGLVATVTFDIRSDAPPGTTTTLTNFPSASTSVGQALSTVGRDGIVTVHHPITIEIQRFAEEVYNPAIDRGEVPDELRRLISRRAVAYISMNDGSTLILKIVTDEEGRIVEVKETREEEIPEFRPIAKISTDETTFWALARSDDPAIILIFFAQGKIRIEYIWTVAIRLTRATGRSKITAGKIGIRAGDPADFAATVTDAEGDPVDQPVTWSVEGEAGTMDQNGHFVASIRAGDTGALIATAGDVSDTVFVTILANLLKRIEIIPASVELSPGGRVTFKAQGYDAYDNKVSVRPFWHVTRGIGTISSITGTFVAGDTPGSGDVVAFAQAVFGDASTEVSGSAKVVVRAVPDIYALHPNLPNPFNARTTIQYDLPMAGKVMLVVYDLSGHAVRTLVSEAKEAGSYSVVWDGTDDQRVPVASGIYIGRLLVRAGFGAGDHAAFTRTRKMCLVR